MGTNIKKHTAFWSFMIFASLALGQKPPINFETLEDWDRLGRCEISNNGKYIWYEHLSSSPLRGDSLIIRSIDSSFRTAVSEGSAAVFSEDGQYLFFIAAKRFHMLNLVTHVTKVISDVSRFVIKRARSEQWVAAMTGNKLILRGLNHSVAREYDGVIEFKFDEYGEFLVLQKEKSLTCVDLPSTSEKLIYNQTSSECFAIGGRHKRIAFLTKDPSNSRSIRCYDLKKDEVYDVISDTDSIFSNKFSLVPDILWFSEDEKKVFFKVSPITVDVEKDTGLITDKLDVWHYRDKILKSSQLLSQGDMSGNVCTVVSSVVCKQTIILEGKNFTLLNRPKNKFSIVKNVTNDWEAFWNKERQCYKLLSLSSGRQISFMKDTRGAMLDQLSPGEKYIIWRDTVEKKIYSYDINNKATKCVAENIGYNDEFKNSGRSRHIPLHIVGWLKDDQALIVYDRYDIWMLDPEGEKKPICITAGYGRRHGIILRLAFNRQELNKCKIGDSIWLSGLQDSTKFNGFYKTRLGKVFEIWEGKLFPYLYYSPFLFVGDPPAPVKAKSSDVYIVRGQSEKDAPNLFFTYDFVTFYRLSNIEPQAKVNWMKADLINWRLPSGERRSGILYIPENFDSTRKYPLIFHYYEMRSNERYQFKNPSLSDGALDIPWYVSNGYIVFVPDIWQNTGHIGKSVLTTLNSAVDHLLQSYPWIDNQRLGLQGHSFGGFETNFMITHSTIFAAAQASAAPSNCISGYGSIAFGGQSLAGPFEVGQFDLGTTPWDSPSIYIENSPIFRVDKIVTPLLLMHNKDDGSVPFSQSIEMFTAMRRLNKPVWLLQYDGQGHTLDPLSDCSVDFTIRQQQFFDHYLKDTPAPGWLKCGIPTVLKSHQGGLKYDCVVE
jgi:hypothetical protein